MLCQGSLLAGQCMGIRIRPLCLQLSQISVQQFSFYVAKKTCPNRFKLYEDIEAGRPDLSQSGTVWWGNLAFSMISMIDVQT